MSTDIAVVGLCGSARRGSFNQALLRAAGEVAPAGMNIVVFPLVDLPFFDSAATGPLEPAAVTRLKDAIAAADALLIATPEYNSGIPGLLKNAIDWASQPPQQSVLAGKPAAVLGCTTSLGGTVRAQMQLRQTLQYVRVHVLLQPELFVSRAHRKFAAGGRLVDARTREALSQLLIELARWTTHLEAAALAPARVAPPPPASRGRAAIVAGA